MGGNQYRQNITNYAYKSNNTRNPNLGHSSSLIQANVGGRIKRIQERKGEGDEGNREGEKVPKYRSPFAENFLNVPHNTKFTSASTLMGPTYLRNHMTHNQPDTRINISPKQRTPSYPGTPMPIKTQKGVLEVKRENIMEEENPRGGEKQVERGRSPHHVSRRGQGQNTYNSSPHVNAMGQGAQSIQVLSQAPRLDFTTLYFLCAQLHKVQQEFLRKRQDLEEEVHASLLNAMKMMETRMTNEMQEVNKDYNYSLSAQEFFKSGMNSMNSRMLQTMMHTKQH